MSHPNGALVCPGSHQFSLRRVTVRIFQYEVGHGECETCGHLFALNQDGRIRKHSDDGCRHGVFTVNCRRGQREELPGSYIVAEASHASGLVARALSTETSEGDRP